MKPKAIFLSALLFLCAGQALAADSFNNAEEQRPGQKTAPRPQEESATIKITRDARGRKIQHIDFNDAVIEGKAKTPDGALIQSRMRGRFTSLIELRSHFRENIKIQSLEAAAPLGINN